MKYLVADDNRARCCPMVRQTKTMHVNTDGVVMAEGVKDTAVECRELPCYEPCGEKG